MNRVSDLTLRVEPDEKIETSVTRVMWCPMKFSKPDLAFVDGALLV